MMKGTYAFYGKDIERQKYFITKQWFAHSFVNLILKNKIKKRNGKTYFKKWTTLCHVHLQPQVIPLLLKVKWE